MSKTKLLIVFIWMDKIKILAMYFSLPDPGKPCVSFVHLTARSHALGL